MDAPTTNSFEVSEPILNGPFAEPTRYWYIREGEEPEIHDGRRPALVFPPRDQKTAWGERPGIIRKSTLYPAGFELELVNELRARVAAWRAAGYPGVSRTTLDLLKYWSRPDRERKLFFAQLEAVETIILLREARADFRQGIAIPRDEPSESQRAEGYAGFERLACKMATGSGKTTVMAMLAAWSILNKVNGRADATFSDVVLIICPNITIRDRLRELDPNGGEASLYRTRDLVPPHYMDQLRQGRVLVTNWHVFNPQTPQVGGTGGRVVKTGKPVTRTQTIFIGDRNTTARGRKYLTLDEFNKRVATSEYDVNPRREVRDDAGNLVRADVTLVEHTESDTALVQRVLGREVGGKRKILVMNDEAHHAYRIVADQDEDEQDTMFGEDEAAEAFYKEATVWVEGLDKVHKLRGINMCVDLSATPYFLGRVGQETNKPFPWVISDFGLIEAIESGLVKIPQLAVSDSTGAAIPGYFNIWRWIMEEQLTPAERGGGRNPKPEAILKYANTPITMLYSLWDERFKKLASSGDDQRPPVFILVCKNTRIAKVVYEWLAENKCPTGIPSSKLDAFSNLDGQINTIRVDSKVVQETDTGEAKNDESAWMRFTLDTVGRRAWPTDSQSRPIYPEGFEALAVKLERGLAPPGRDVRCIVSVGMLTEGWDCNTVAHIIGLRPFMSQLLCEQVVGRGLRRSSYDTDADGKFTEEVAKVLGVPFEVIPFKANPQGPPPAPVKRWHVHAVPQKASLGIQFPRVEGYRQAVLNRLAVDWDRIAPLTLTGAIPPEVDVKGLSLNDQGRMSLTGPNKLETISLKQFRDGRRIQELVFDMAQTFTKNYIGQNATNLPAHVLFPQLTAIIGRYIREKVTAMPPADVKDLFLSPWYGWMIERLRAEIHGDTDSDETPEVPIYETNRGPGSTSEVDFWTSRDVREVVKSHLNYVVADTNRWEQSAAWFIDHHPAVTAFVKNAGLGFAIPYFDNGQDHDYIPDFILRLAGDAQRHLILETKGYDPLELVKRQAAERWVSAVNADGQYGHWSYAIARRPEDVLKRIDEAVEKAR